MLELLQGVGNVWSDPQSAQAWIALAWALAWSLLSWASITTSIGVVWGSVKYGWRGGRAVVRAMRSQPTSLYLQIARCMDAAGSGVGEKGGMRYPPGVLITPKEHPTICVADPTKPGMWLDAGRELSRRERRAILRRCRQDRKAWDDREAIAAHNMMLRCLSGGA